MVQTSMESTMPPSTEAAPTAVILLHGIGTIHTGQIIGSALKVVSSYFPALAQYVPSSTTALPIAVDSRLHLSFADVRTPEGAYRLVELSWSGAVERIGLNAPLRSNRLLLSTLRSSPSLGLWSSKLSGPRARTLTGILGFCLQWASILYLLLLCISLPLYAAYTYDCASHGGCGGFFGFPDLSGLFCISPYYVCKITSSLWIYLNLIIIAAFLIVVLFFSEILLLTVLTFVAHKLMGYVKALHFSQAMVMVLFSCILYILLNYAYIEIMSLFAASFDKAANLIYRAINALCGLVSSECKEIATRSETNVVPFLEIISNTAQLVPIFVVLIAVGNLVRDIVIYLTPGPDGSPLPHQVLIRDTLWKTILACSAEGFSRIFVVAHSMGTIVALDTLLENKDTSLGLVPKCQIELITAGSPLRRFINRFLPGRMSSPYLILQELLSASSFSFQGWSNVYRVADYVGQSILHSSGLGFLSRTNKGENVEARIGIQETLLKPWWRRPFSHANYWMDRRFVEFIGEKIVRGHPSSTPSTT
jgi:hypothetical protein